MGRWMLGWMAVGGVLGLAALIAPGPPSPGTVATAASVGHSAPAKTEPVVAGVLVNRAALPDCLYPDACSPAPTCVFDSSRTVLPQGFAPVHDDDGGIITYDPTTVNVDVQLAFRFGGCEPTTTRWLLTSGPDAGDSGEAAGPEVTDRPRLQCRYDDNGAVTELGLRGEYTVEAFDADGNVLPGGRTVVEVALTRAECESAIFNDA